MKEILLPSIPLPEKRTSEKWKTNSETCLPQAGTMVLFYQSGPLRTENDYKRGTECLFFYFITLISHWPSGSALLSIRGFNFLTS